MNLFWGKVRTGHKRGKDLGFPTANVRLNKSIAEGIYISKVRVKHTWFPALTFIGAAETFNEKEKKAETYILDFNQNIYEEWITIRLLKKIRDSQKFESVENLKKQMSDDEKKARFYFNSNTHF